MVKALTAIASMFLLAMSVAAAPNAVAAGKGGCDTTKPLVIRSHVTYQHVIDFGADGHIWALDSATQTFRAYRIGRHAFCVARHDEGTFVTFAGVSPEGTGSLTRGKTGTFSASIHFKIRGKLSPTLPTSGFVGSFDAQCHHDGTCDGEEPGLLGRYFSPVTAFRVVSFAASYVGEDGCGTWTQTLAGDTGDIVC
jgi:hypothetical protein